MTQEETPALRPILLVIAAMFAFSLMVVFTRGADANILGVSAWRAIIVAVVFAFSAVIREGGVAALRPDPTTLKLGAWLGVALAIASSTFVGGYALTTAANTIFLHNLAPVFVFPLAWWLFKERSGSAAITGAAISLFGVAMLSGVSLFQVSHFASSRFLLGDLLSFVSAIGYAAVLVLTRMTRNEGTPILGTLFVAWTIAAIALTLIAIAGGGFAVSASSLVWIVGLAVISTNIPFYLLNLGMKHVPAGTAAVLSLSEVLFTTVIGIIVYSEHLAPIGWVGAALAGIGVLYAVTQRNSQASPVPSTADLPPSIRSSRAMRAGVGLLVLNVGAIATISGGSSIAPLATLIGLSMVARHGPAVGLSMLEGRFEAAIRLAGVALGLTVVWTAYQWAGSIDPQASILGALLCVAVIALDRKIAGSEEADVRDDQPLVLIAIAMVGLSMVFASMGHGMARVALETAIVFIAVQGFGVLLSSIAGTSTTARPGLTNLEATPARWTKGKRPLLGITALWLLGAVHTVPTGHVGIIERFGAPSAQTDGSGLTVRFPAPIETITAVNVGAEQQLDVGEHTLLTGDQSLISLRAVTRFSIGDPVAYAYGASTPNQALEGLARAALVDVVSGASQDALLTTGRSDIEAKVKTALQVAVNDADLGIEVSDVHLTTVTVPAPVVAAFLDVITADEDRQERINTAEAYEADLIPRTRGEAIARISNAQGDAERIEANAIGFDVWFRSIERNGRKSPRLTRARIAAEATEAALAGSRIIAAPNNVRVWLDGEGHWPREPTLAEEQ